MIGYPAFGKILNETGRPMVYSCSWPAYQTDHMVPDYKSIAKHCNLWRNWDDIQDSWTSVLSIIDWFAEHQDEFQQFAGPGNWNDPDMVSNIDATISVTNGEIKFKYILSSQDAINIFTFFLNSSS